VQIARPETDRGKPALWMNPDDARARGIRDGEEVRAYNDAGEFIVSATLAPAVRPGQVICYNGWEPFMFRGWRDPANVEPGMVESVDCDWPSPRNRRGLGSSRQASSRG
jgi:anaerobic selenocysteine-containing dehydrogenase